MSDWRVKMIRRRDELQKEYDNLPMDPTPEDLKRGDILITCIQELNATLRKFHGDDDAPFLPELERKLAPGGEG